MDDSCLRQERKCREWDLVREEEESRENEGPFKGEECTNKQNEFNNTGQGGHILRTSATQKCISPLWFRQMAREDKRAERQKKRTG